MGLLAVDTNTIHYSYLSLYEVTIKMYDVNIHDRASLPLELWVEGGTVQLLNQQPSLKDLPEGQQAVNNNTLFKPISWAQNKNGTKCDRIGAKHWP